MKQQLKFKTTINCGGCVASVTPALNHVAGIGNWRVDIDNPSKILTIDSDTATKESIVEAVNKVGFKAEPLEELNN